MYVVLVGVEIWVERDEIEIVDNADTTMNNFLEYRRNHISPKHRNDNAQLITSVSFTYSCNSLYRVGQKPNHSSKLMTPVCDDEERCPIYQVMHFYLAPKIEAFSDALF